MKRPVTDNLADTPVEINARCKTQIDTARPKFRCDEPASPAYDCERGIRIAVVLTPDHAHRRNRGEASPEPLHAPPFVVHSNDRWRAAQGAHCGDKVCKLFRRRVIAAEEDQAADGRLEQQVAVSRCQAETIDVEHHGP